MARPLFVDPNLLRPLPKALHGVACVACDRRQGMWEHTKQIRGRKGEFVCSLCWLYNSAWTPGTEEDLADLIERVEEHMGLAFDRTDSGQLKNCSDADRILSSIVMSSRLFLLRGKVVSWDKKDD